MRNRGLSALAAPVLLLIAANVDAGPPSTGLNGTFSVTLPEGSNWDLTFWQKGKFTLARNGRQDVEGYYSVDGDTVQFTDQKGPGAARGPEQTGKYRWKLDGRRLTLVRLKDRNTGRESIFTAGPLEQRD